MSNELIPYQDIERMGNAIAKSGLFGMKTPEAAVALMLVAQAQGRHPATVAMEYDVIQGKPALKSQAALMRFQEAGGKIEYITRTDAEVSAKFTHAQGGTLVVTWNMERARKMALSEKDNWKRQPMIMLQWRVVAEGVRACYPACLGGSYLVEEVQDFDDKPQRRVVTETTATVVPGAKAGHVPEITHEQFVGSAPVDDGNIDEFNAALGGPPPGDQQPEPPRQLPSSDGDERVISEPQAKRIFAIMKSAGKTIEEVKAIVAIYGYGHSKEIKRKDYAAICAEIEKPPVAQ